MDVAGSNVEGVKGTVVVARDFGDGFGNDDTHAIVEHDGSVGCAPYFSLYALFVGRHSWCLVLVVERVDRAAIVAVKPGAVCCEGDQVGQGKIA